METVENGLHDAKCGLGVSGCSQHSRLCNGVAAGSHTKIGSISVWMAMMVR